MNYKTIFFHLTQLLFLTLFINHTFSQAFVKITDAQNPIVSFTPPGNNYSGAAWVDYDNDGDLDLSVTPRFLFRNDGVDSFTQVQTNIGSNQTNQLGNGISWADYDNDGDLDCYLAGNPSTLYEQDNGTFTAITISDISANLNHRGWAAAWEDYDRDGLLDLVMTHPAGFIGPSSPNRLFRQVVPGLFSRIDTFHFTSTFAPFTVATWSDFDDDNDPDLFIGSGPAGVPARDYIYINLLTETGKPGFQRMDNLPMGSDLQDGQTWNWVDFDNDRDLDGIITNYSGAKNRFYRNDDGVYNSITNPMTVWGNYLANTWGDMDLDGDLDVIMTNDNASTGYYENQGDGTFLAKGNNLTEPGFTSGATLGDYDNDGDLDVFVSGTTGKALFRNDLNNNRHWISFSLTGTSSNKAAIGAKVHLKTQIQGKSTWQRREISAQNSFNSHNSLRAHFGLDSSLVADSVIIQWPSGVEDIYTNLAADSLYRITETENTAAGPRIDPINLKVFPNPFQTSITIRFPSFFGKKTHIEIIDLSGRTILEKAIEGKDHYLWNGKTKSGIEVNPGIFIVVIHQGEKTGRGVLVKE